MCDFSEFLMNFIDFGIRNVCSGLKLTHSYNLMNYYDTR
jgi:hypothetical protein